MENSLKTGPGTEPLKRGVQGKAGGGPGESGGGKGSEKEGQNEVIFLTFQSFFGVAFSTTFLMDFL